MKMVGPRGRTSVHTLSCYSDTWEKYSNLKKKLGKTADEMLNLLLNNYKQSTIPNEKKALLNIKNEIQKRIDQLNKIN